MKSHRAPFSVFLISLSFGPEQESCARMFLKSMGKRNLKSQSEAGG